VKAALVLLLALACSPPDECAAEPHTVYLPIPGDDGGVTCLCTNLEASCSAPVACSYADGGLCPAVMTVTPGGEFIDCGPLLGPGPLLQPPTGPQCLCTNLNPACGKPTVCALPDGGAC
jgi:hypothetical protein